MATVLLSNLTKRYGPLEIVHGIDLEVADREFIALVGPSGCGKSTTLRMIAGLEEISAGEVRIGGRVVNDLPPRARNIAMVFQSYALYPHFSVRENLGFSLKIAGRPQPEIDARVAEAAAILGLEPLMERRPSQLSGGQRQRVAMGRAIVRNPDVFLFDEPLSNLDAKLRTQMRTEIKKLHAKVTSTVIYVTHDQVEAMTLADRIVIMRDGTIEQTGTPDEVFKRPATRYVAGFIGSPPMNLREATVDDGRLAFGDGLALPLPRQFQGRVAAGDRVTFGLRPDDLYPRGHGIHAGEEGEVHDLDLSVTLTEPLGNETLVFADFGGAELVSRMLNPRPLKAGDTVAMSFDLSRAHLFASDTGKTLEGMTMARIEKIDLRMVDLVPKVKRTDAIQSFVSQETPIVTVTDSDGATGTGYSYTIGTGGSSVMRLLADHLAPRLIGRDADQIEAIWHELEFATHATTIGAITAIALAAIDTALWDLRARKQQLPLWKLAGGAKEKCPLYTTEGGWLHIDTRALVDDAVEAKAKGFTGSKVKIGHPHGSEDHARLSAVRKAVGDGYEIMTDANQGFTLDEAIRRAERLRHLDLAWIEEPIAADDIDGHVRLSARTSTPIAVGESLYSIRHFREYMARGGCSIVQVDVGRIGGITPWLKVAHAAEAFDMPVCPHFLMELHVSLVCAVQNGKYVEYIPQLDDLTGKRMTIRDGHAHAPSDPGIGIDWDWDAVQRMSVEEFTREIRQ